ncbi:type II toxin-antitoxin system VapC family toxin [Iningainema tapete]|nr:PIN domain-containing protein [Iningainema tapete]
MIILLDTGPLGLISNPSKKEEAVKCREWITSLDKNFFSLYIPEISDYEVRRELIRCKKLEGLRRLDLLKDSENFTYVPITTEVMLKAAELWAWAHNTGQQTASAESLDADVILSATAIVLARLGVSVIIATTNVNHLERYTPAKHWKDAYFLTAQP